MPDAIAAQYEGGTNEPIYFALGPIPPKAYLLALTGVARAGVDLWLSIAHVQTLQDAADAGAHAAGRRLLARSNVVFNTAPGYTIAILAHATVTWLLPLNLHTSGGAAWIITNVISSAALGAWALLLTVEWLSTGEHARLYGTPLGVTVITPPRTPPLAAVPAAPRPAVPRPY